MATETNLGTVHLFPSKTSYDTNKSSVSASDIALVPTPRIPIEASDDGRNWYIKYSDGWIEQGGELTWSSVRNASGKNITFYTPFTNANTVCVTLTSITTAGYNATSCIKTESITTNQVTVNCYGIGSSDRSVGMHWRASGY